MAIIKDNGSEETTMKKVKVKRVTKHKPKYTCNLCKDSGVIEVKGKRVKCNCIVKRDIKAWIPSYFRRGIGIEQLDLSDKKSFIFYGNETISFKNVEGKTLRKFIYKALVYRYYKNSMRIFDYYDIRGDNYTDDYVKGEHLKYHRCKNLFLRLGDDNKNVTLLTTMKNLVIDRVQNNLPTWIIYSRGVDVETLEGLYGDNFVKYIDGLSSYIVEGKNKQILIKKKSGDE